MTVPSKVDIQKREAKLKEFLKKLDSDGKASEKFMVSVVRSAIRNSWMKSPTKLAYLYMNTIPDMDDSTRTKWLSRCEMCGELFKLTDLQVDHRIGNHSFTKLDDFESYFNNILMVGFDDLQILCKQDHEVKTLSEANGISIEQARVLKEVIRMEKAKSDVAFIKKAGYTPGSNKDKRREQMIEILSGGNNARIS